MAPDEWELGNRALDVQAPLDDRIAAIEELGRSGSSAALSPLLELGERQAEPPGILRAAGSALAALVHRDAHISEFDMRDLQGLTYEAFCAWEP
jgi:hypothetical protein